MQERIFILLTLGRKPLIRPVATRYFYEVRGADIHCIGSKNLCVATLQLLKD